MKEGSRANEAHPRWVMWSASELTQTLCGWAFLIAASLLGFWLSEGTPYHQFTIGVLLSSTSLFILTTLFEVLWRAMADR